MPPAPGTQLWMHAVGIAAAWLLTSTCTALRVPSAPSGNTASRPSSSANTCAAVQRTETATAGIRIPKILHQTYKSEELPPGFRRYRKSWLLATPDWEHHLWLDADNRALIADHYPWFLGVYDSYLQNAQRVDAARVFMMHRYGGMYADLDIEVMSDPAILLGGDFDIALFYDWSHWDGYSPDTGRNYSLDGLTNSLMASVPGHPYWLKLAMGMVDRYINTTAMPDTDVFKLFSTTGPFEFTIHFYSWMVRWPQTSVAVYPRKYWSPYVWNQPDDPCSVRRKCYTAYPEAIVVSHWTGTWHKCNPEEIAQRPSTGYSDAYCTIHKNVSTGHCK